LILKIHYQKGKSKMEKSIFDNFKWINESKATFVDGKLVIVAPEKSDFFCNNGAISETGITPESLCNAPFYYTEVTGDFVMRVKVSHNFKDTYDSASVMIMQDLQVWAKSCFEKTDFDTHAVVSVVTNHTSDDANGCNIDGNTVWLQITRVSHSFSFHYSLDGKKFDMTRFFTLPVDKTIKVGLVAQAPTGKGGDRIYENFSLENKTVANIRYGK
jgi:regulation of enolase protein 1 (concanavalin A-like superfamily)